MHTRAKQPKAHNKVNKFRLILEIFCYTLPSSGSGGNEVALSLQVVLSSRVEECSVPAMDGVDPQRVGGPAVLQGSEELSQNRCSTHPVGVV